MGHRLPQAAPQGARALQHRQPSGRGRHRRGPCRLRRADGRAARVARRSARGAGARRRPDRRQGPARLLVRPGVGAGHRRARRRPALAHRAAPPRRGGRLARHRLPLQPVRRPPADQGDLQRRRLGARRAAHREGRARHQAVVRPLHRPARRLARRAGPGAAAARARAQHRPDVHPLRADHHPVDDFIEPSMRKSTVTWDDVRTPEWLRDMAEEVWQLLGVLTDEPHDEGTLQTAGRDPRRLHRELRRRRGAHLRPHAGRGDTCRTRGARGAEVDGAPAAPRPRAGASGRATGRRRARGGGDPAPGRRPEGHRRD